MYNDNDLDERWNDFITKLNEARYNDRKTYPGDPTGNYDETGTYNKLGPDEEQATFYSQEDADKNIPILLPIPAAVRFVSLEPLLENIDLHISDSRRDIIFRRTHGQSYERRFIDWLIIGCESGPKRRPCKLEWVRNIVEQCRAAQVPVFVKQLSIDGKVNHNPADWPEDLRIREYPK